MGNIVLLDELTINQIAAGEVIERPASVIKEVVENSIDAGAKNITIEIKNGGISFIRITDNGKGIARDDVELAFTRHATSKIRSAEDLNSVKSMGFRGEALASISAIANVELVSKTEEEQVGTRIVVEGGDTLSIDEIGCPKGTTITVRNLFFNTPVRYKFLKKDFTESGYIEDVVTRIALVHPEISIKLINSGKTVIQTNGNGDLKSVIYSIFGKEIASNLMNVEYEYEYIKRKGVIGRPQIARSNRTNQIFFVNGRYIKDKTLSSAVEQAFKGMLPIGKYAFLILNLEINPAKVDVNVHPAKLEVRFAEEDIAFKAMYHSIKDTLLKEGFMTDRERAFEIKEATKDAFKIPNIEEKIKQTYSVSSNFAQEKNNPNMESTIVISTVEQEKKENVLTEQLAENFEPYSKQQTLDTKAIATEHINEESLRSITEQQKQEKDTLQQEEKMEQKDEEQEENVKQKNEQQEENIEQKDEEKLNEINLQENDVDSEKTQVEHASKENILNNELSFESMYKKLFGKEPYGGRKQEEPEQEENYYTIDTNMEDSNLSMFEQNEDYKNPAYKFIGIAFNTYIILEINNEIYIMDQHAAHERIMYEKVKKNFFSKDEKSSQLLLLPDIITLTHKEMDIAKDNFDLFEKAGFILEEFGENTIKLSGVPDICIDLDTAELFKETLDEINTVARTAKQEREEKFIATIACKSAVKANMCLTKEEVDSLMEELLELPNPFTCPHGRPTVIKMSKYEIERKFARK